MLGKIIPIMVASCSMAVNPTQRNVIYNDNEREIILTASELNHYTFLNLGHWFSNIGDDNDFYGQISETVIDYNNIVYDFDEYYNDPNDTDSQLINYVNGDSHIYFMFGSSVHDYLIEYKFILLDDTNNTTSPFEHDITWELSDLGSTKYNGVKSAIEQDISSNETTNMPSASDLFEVIGQGVSEFAEVMGEVFQNITQLFWTTGANPGPTFLGLLTLLAVGAGLIYLGYRIIAGLVRRLRG